MSGRNNVLITVVIIVFAIIAGLLLPFLLWSNLHENNTSVQLLEKIYIDKRNLKIYEVKTKIIHRKKPATSIKYN